MASNSSEEDVASSSEEVVASRSSEEVVASSSAEECVCVKLFAEEMLKCLLIDSRIRWNPSWGFQIETSVSIDGLLSVVLPDLNFCREQISLSVSEASRRFHSIVLQEVSDICEQSSDKDKLLQSLIDLEESYYDFLTLMAIAKDICIRFHREEKSHLIANVLEAVVYFMEHMNVFGPVLLRISIEKFMMACTSSEDSFVSTKYFAEKLFKCLLIDCNIPWNPSWGVLIETSVSIDCVARKVSEHLNACHELISKCISIVFRRDSSTVEYAVSYVLSHSSDKDMLPKSLIAVGESSQCFFTFMAIAKDICIRFHREEKSHLIADVLKAVVYFMDNMSVSHPELFIREASDFITTYGP